MKRDIPVHGVFNLFYLLVGCLTGRIFAGIVNRVVGWFVEVDFFTAALIHLVLISLISFGLCIFLSYKEGYREKSVDGKEIFLSALWPVGLHYLVAIPLRFAPLCFGGTRLLAGFIALGSNYNDASRNAEIPIPLMLLLGVVMGALYCLCLTLPKKIGENKREKDRVQLTENEANS